MKVSITLEQLREICDAAIQNDKAESAISLCLEWASSAADRCIKLQSEVDNLRKETGLMGTDIHAYVEFKQGLDFECFGQVGGSQ